MLVFKVLCEVDLQFWFVDGNKISVGHGHHVHLLLLVLLGGHGSLPDADSDLVAGDGVTILQWLHFQLVLVVRDHGPELPVGVIGILVPQCLLFLQDLRLLGPSLLSVLLQLLHFFDNV